MWGAEVSLLRELRHGNVVTYMGACLEQARPAHVVLQPLAVLASPLCPGTCPALPRVRQLFSCAVHAVRSACGCQIVDVRLWMIVCMCSHGQHAKSSGIFAVDMVSAHAECLHVQHVIFVELC